MATHRPLLLLASVALLTGALGACSQGASSPTEPSLTFDDVATKSGGDDDGSDNGGRRGGSDDDGTAGDDNRRGRGRGNDDGSADDNNRQRRNRGRGGRGRGGDDRPGQPQPTPTPGQPQPTPTPQAPRGGAEFEARVASVNGDTITLTNGTRIIVNGQTTWSARGDLHSLADIRGSLAAGLNPRVEGRGNRQADGSIVAVTIKGEHDGD